MREVNIEIRIPGPRLPVVVREIIDRILADDWERRSTKDCNRFYYVIGEYAAGLSEHKADFEVSDFPGAKATDRPKLPGPRAEHFVRSQTADKHPDYLERAKRNLMQFGPTNETIDRFINKDPKVEIHPLINEIKAGLDGLNSLAEFLQAYALGKSRKKAIEQDMDESHENDVTREKLYLQQVCDTYQRMVDRASQLDPLSFSDPQLNEAAWCFLAGLLRASVLLSASAVEKHLKDSTGKKRFETYESFVDFAFMGGKIGKEWVEDAKRVFSLRTKVMHHNYRPSDDEASGALGKARGVVGDVLLRAPKASST